MNDEIVCAISGTSITAVIAAMNIPADALVLGEEQPQRVIGRTERAELLHFAHYEPAIELERYTSGRLFCSTFELRWLRQDGKLRIVYTGQSQTAPTHGSDVLTVEKFREGHYILFGKRHPVGTNSSRPQEYTIFSDVRIPRLLNYPIEVKGDEIFVQLQVREYLSATGAVEAYRFVGLREEKKA